MGGRGISRYEYYVSPNNHAIIADAMHEILPSFEDEKFAELIFSDEENIRQSAFRLAIDSGLIESNPDVLFEPSTTMMLEHSKTRQNLPLVLHLLSAQRQDYVFGRLTELILSGDLSQRAYALTTVSISQRHLNQHVHTQSNAYKKLIDCIITHTTTDDRIPFADNPRRQISEIAARVVAEHDKVGDVVIAVQLARLERGLDPTGPIPWPALESESYSTLADLWYVAFADYADSHSVITRRWIAMYLPSSRGSVYDDQIDQIARKLLDESDWNTRNYAYRGLQTRNATHLIPEGFQHPTRGLQ